MFDLPSMLGEYLLPLVLVVPLAVVLVLLASRNTDRDDPTRDRRPPAPAAWTPPPRPPTPDTPQPPSEALARPAHPVVEFAPTSPFIGSLEVTQPNTRPMAQPLPAVEAPPADAPPPPAAGSPVPVLIVDDSAVVRAKLTKLLAGAGYAVTAARHGHEAIEQLNQHWFAMMITDLEMPEMDGFELIAHAGNDLRTENLPIVAITGHEALHAKVQDAKGLFGIFKKPWNDRELLARVAVLTQLRPRS